VVSDLAGVVGGLVLAVVAAFAADGAEGGVVLAGSVEADQGMEVHDRAAPAFGDLDEGDPAPLAELRWRQPGPPGEGAAQGDGEPAPQLWRVPVNATWPDTAAGP